MKLWGSHQFFIDGFVFPHFLYFYTYQGRGRDFARAGTFKSAVTRITVCFSGSNEVASNGVAVASTFTRFFHIGSVQLYRPLRLAFIPTVCSNAITDDHIQLTGANHPLHRFNVYEQLFQADDGSTRSDWTWQLRLFKLAATHALMPELIPEKQVAHRNRALSGTATHWKTNWLSSHDTLVLFILLNGPNVRIQLWNIHVLPF